MLDTLSAPAMPRLLSSVTDCRRDPPAAIDTAALLDPLSAGEVAQLRREITAARAGGTDLFRCPVCGSGLILSTRPLGPGRTGGGRTFFKHVRAGDPCPLTDERAWHPDAIDAARFDGRQEGARHHLLKTTLAAMAEADPAFTDVAVERAIPMAGGWRRPDVQAVLGGTRVVFEVQLASLQLPRMMAREQAYEAAGMRLVWVVDADRIDDAVWRQGHQDLLAGQSGRLLALGDAQVAAVTGRAEEDADPSSCVLVTVEERDGAFDLDRRALGLAEAVDRVAPADPAARAPLARDPYSRAVFAALAEGDTGRIDRAIGDLCNLLDLEETAWDAGVDGVPAAVAALGTALTGRRCDASGHGATEASAILNTFLNTRRHRHWAPLLARAGAVSPRAAALLARGSTARKLAAALEDREPGAPDFAAPWRSLFAHLFPVLRTALRTPENALPAA